MKKALTLALVIGMLFVLSTASFALWGFGGKKTGGTKVMTSEAKGKVMTKAKKVETKKVMVKKVKKGKKVVKTAVPAKK
jgi:hypothetical protein